MRSVLSIFDCPSELCYSKFFLEAAATEIQHTYAYVCLYFCVYIYIRMYVYVGDIYEYSRCRIEVFLETESCAGNRERIRGKGKNNRDMIFSSCFFFWTFSCCKRVDTNHTSLYQFLVFSMYIIYICICMYEYIYTCRSYKIYIHLILLFGFCECHVNAGLGHVLQCNKVYGTFEFP